MNNRSADLTVIIPFLNEASEIRNTVASLRDTAEGTVDILLINDCSNDSGGTPPKYHPSTTQVENLIEIIGDGTYSVSEMMEKLQLNNRRYFTKEYLKAAITEGYVELLYPHSPRHPKQKYSLTEKGKLLLK